MPLISLPLPRPLWSPDGSGSGSGLAAVATTHAPPECVVLMPALNEAAHIEAALGDLLAEPVNWPILVLDGGSMDGTREIVLRIAAGCSRVRLINNPAGRQAAAINLGAGIAKGLGARVILRADAHARYPAGFMRGMVRTLNRQNCDSVVTSLIASEPGPDADPWSRASALLQRSWLGTGGAAHRVMEMPPGPVCHGHHAAFRLSAFLALGGYDRDFVANEDAEFDLRLVGAGGKIFLQPRWPVAYTPRPRPKDLFRQYLRNGWWRVRTAKKHGTRLGLRQALPVLATAVNILSILIAPVFPAALLVPVAYAAALTGLSLQAGQRDAMLAGRIACLALLMQASFGIGAMASLLLAYCGLPTEKAGAR